MAILNRIPKDLISKNFTHKGWFYLCPVYLRDVDTDLPIVAERNWVPSLWLELMALCHVSINMLMPQGQEYEFPFRIAPLERK